jgi:lipopolysaccharide/colanic/teichoic acid biosynthesis glycosyltransferase
MRTRSPKLKGEQWINSSEKRAMDIAFVMGMLPIAAPLGAGAIALSRIVDGKDPIFTQDRIGSNGEIITIKKVRTMTPFEGQDGEVDGPQKRITKLGVILRQTGIDEIPQLANVMHGSMSIVGPRIWIDSEPESMQAVLPRVLFEEWEDAYNKSRPGIISSFHIIDRSGSYDEQTRLQKAQLDLHDFNNTSLAYDLRLIGRAAAMASRHALGQAYKNKAADGELTLS